MPLRALVLDFDGLILDTESAILRAWEAEYERHGVAFPSERFIRANVGSIRGQPGYLDEYDELERLIGRAVDRDEVERRRVAMHAEHLDGLGPNPGVVEWLDAARSAGLALGVASSSTREWVDGHLRRLGLRDRFAVLATRDEVGGRGKPDPAVYLHALAALGVDGAEAAALEDSPAGVRAARAAGLFCVAVPSEITRVLDFPEADVVAESLAAFSLDDLLAILESFRRRTDGEMTPEHGG